METQVIFHDQFYFISTFKCFIQSSIFSTFALFCFVFVFLRSDLKHLQIVFQHDGNNLSTIAKFLSSSY